MRRGEFSLNALPAWCALNDVSFIDVKVDDVEGRGYGLVADRDLINDEDNVEVPTLLTVPKDLVLSAEAVEEYAKVDKNFRELYEAAGHQVCSCTGATTCLRASANQRNQVTSREYPLVSTSAASDFIA